jgi:hypothetical protein
MLTADVEDTMAGKRVVFFTLFHRWFEQTVNLPGEGGEGSIQPGGQREGGGVRTRGSGHTREFD